ncbi:MAG: amidohydrolase family protein, partial [Cytophagaceae bacterium]|nr:amidohydrolase family protein [Gemmatimonadaceae bacterium]
AEKAAALRQAAGRPKSTTRGMWFVKENVGTSAGKPVHAVVRVISPEAEALGDGSQARAAALEGMEQGDVFEYGGHARYGTGPDFDRNYRFTVDWDKLPRIAALTARSGVANTPTLALFQVAFIRPLPMDSLLALPGVDYLLPAARGAHEQNLRAFWNTPRDPVLLSTMDEFRNRMTKALADAGATLLVGSDSPNALFMPGFSIHRELRALQQAGLTPYQVLRAATVSAASYLGLEREFGTVAPGVGADLLLLTANPLSGLATLERPDGVMTRGRWLPRETLDAILQGAKP